MATHSAQFPTWNLIKLARKGETPLYAQIEVQIRDAIVSGAIPDAARLPPSRIMADELKVSRNTVLLAYERLTADGFLIHRQGDGTFASLPVPRKLRPKSVADGTASLRRDQALSSRGQTIAQVGVPLERTFGFDLSPLVPAADHFPYDAFNAIFRRYWHSLPAADVVYGEPGGLPYLRQQIAHYLGVSRGIICTPEQIIVCGSTLQGIQMSAFLLLEPGDEIIVEDPGHTGEIMLLESLGHRTVSIRCDREGLDLRQMPPEAARARMVVATPVAQFPFGSNMSPERCTAIIDWARTHNGWVFEDDTNSEYRWSGTPRPPLITLGQQEKIQQGNRVIYAGSFNRALAPGMRLAFIVVPTELIDAFTAAQQMSGSHYPLMVQRAVADFLKDGRFARHLRKQRPIYQQRAEALIDALRKTFGDRLELPQLEAGLQLTVVTTEPCDDVAISDAALRVGLDVPALSPHCRLPQKLTGFLLGFGNTPVERIPNAVARLEKVMTQVQQRSAPIR